MPHKQSDCGSTMAERNALNERTKTNARIQIQRNQKRLAGERREYHTYATITNSGSREKLASTALLFNLVSTRMPGTSAFAPHCLHVSGSFATLPKFLRILLLQNLWQHAEVYMSGDKIVQKHGRDITSFKKPTHRAPTHSIQNAPRQMKTPARDPSLR